MPQRAIDVPEEGVKEKDRVHLLEQVATCREDITRIREDWWRFLEQQGEVTLDVMPEFFLAALEWLEGAPKPYVVVFRHESGPRGLIVGRTRTRRLTARLGYLTVRTPALRSLEVVYGGLVTDGSEESRTAILDHLSDVLVNGRIEHVSVHHLPSGHPLYQYLAAGFEGTKSGPSKGETHWYRALVDPPTGELKEPHSGKNRRRHGRYDRSLIRHFDGDVDVEEITEVGGVDRFLQRAAAITQRSYQNALGVGIQDSDLWRRTLVRLAELGFLRAYLLVARKQPIAYEFAAAYGKRCTLIAQGFLPEHWKVKPGNFLLRRVFERLAAEGVQSVDFGFGDAWHKRLYGTHSRDEVTFTLFGNGGRPALARWVLLATERVSALVAQSLRRGGVFGRIKNAWRRKLEDAGDR